jgi:hypothetical protein
MAGQSSRQGLPRRGAGRGFVSLPDLRGGHGDHEGQPKARHGARDRAPVSSSCAGHAFPLRLPAPLRRPKATTDRRGVHEGQGGDLRRWLLLALLPRARIDSRSEPQLLATKARQKRCPRSGARRRVGREWMASHPCLGARGPSRGCRSDRRGRQPSPLDEAGEVTALALVRRAEMVGSPWEVPPPSSARSCSRRRRGLRPGISSSFSTAVKGTRGSLPSADQRQKPISHGAGRPHSAQGDRGRWRPRGAQDTQE